MRTVTYRINRRTFDVSLRTDTDRDGYPKGWLVVERLRDDWNREVARGLRTLRDAKMAVQMEVRG